MFEVNCSFANHHCAHLNDASNAPAFSASPVSKSMRQEFKKEAVCSKEAGVNRAQAQAMKCEWENWIVLCSCPVKQQPVELLLVSHT